MKNQNRCNIPLLTVFTPTYNRAKILGRTYESLCKQENKDFIWLIIDDGSSDNTGELVKQWQKQQNGFEIQYIYKENGGMHTAHNTAYENIITDLNVCIDSDDMMAENAVETIYRIWGKISDCNYAGIIGLDADFDGKILGTGFSEEGSSTTLSGFYQKGGKGDKKLVYRTDLMKKYPPYPVFGNEKLVPLSYKYLLCDQDYQLYATNSILCNVEYQPEGSTNNMWKQRVRNSKGFAFHKSICMKYPAGIKKLIKDTILYIAFSKLSNNQEYVRESPRKLLTILLIPLGLCMYVIIKKKSGL